MSSRIDVYGGYVIEVVPYSPEHRMYQVEFVRIGRFTRNTLIAFKGLLKMADTLSATLIVRISNKEKGAIRLAKALGLKPMFLNDESTAYVTC